MSEENKVQLSEMTNRSLLGLYMKVNLAAENCIRAHHLDAHGHFHRAKEIEGEILSRMRQIEKVRLIVKHEHE